MSFTSTAICKNCKNTLWNDEYDGTASCSNCFERRPYRTRKAGKHVTPSQRKRIDLVKGYFTKGDTVELRDVKEVFSYGVVLLSFNTSHDEGGLFRIGRRGGLTILSARNNWEATKKAYAVILSGKMGRL